ncbi:MAG: tRNA preQ1(34) S-adenosylmethionine ribosyltransferase-isomerase QueA [Clostridia bacterium]|nr:tRNA preQ1(34) S-adenosylmethionine ribosyltransferase-isomerase QueA [Clostridia bacterium]
MNKKDFYFDLPQELIAQTPIYPRDSSRMLVYNRASKQIEHKHFYDLPSYLRKGDVLVLNNTKVMPARIYGNKVTTGGKIEFLLLKRLDYTHWQVLAKSGRNAQVGAQFEFGEGLTATITDIIEDGIRIAEFSFGGVFEDILYKIGSMPLPPYIKQKLSDQSRYNTVYCQQEGSAAAPTAGLHFTQELLDKIRDMGVQVVEVLLHVGLGTFRPLKEMDITQHIMHSEYYEISQEVADTINLAKQQGHRIIAVGTTSTRVLESVADKDGHLVANKGVTDIFIYPPYKFKVIDALITNFHLPESTLVMLVSALCSIDEVKHIYSVAIEEKYRFFSFGDSTLFI